MNGDDEQQQEHERHHYFDSNASVTQLPCMQSDGKPGKRIYVHTKILVQNLLTLLGHATLSHMT